MIKDPQIWNWHKYWEIGQKRKKNRNDNAIS